MKNINSKVILSNLFPRGTILKEHMVLEIVLGDFRIVDINSNVKNLDKFKKLYEKFKQFRIQLQYKDEVFIIDCLRKISIIN